MNIPWAEGLFIYSMAGSLNIAMRLHATWLKRFKWRLMYDAKRSCLLASQDSTVEWVLSIILDEFKEDLNESSHLMAMYESPKHRI